MAHWKDIIAEMLVPNDKLGSVIDTYIALGEILEHTSGLVEVQVHQNRRQNLRVLVAQQLGHRQRVHPFQAFDARDITALQNAVNQQRRLVVAQRALQHRAHVVVRVRHQQAL